MYSFYHDVLFANIFYFLISILSVFVILHSSLRLLCNDSQFAR